MPEIIGNKWARTIYQWCTLTDESRARGFGPFGRRTEVIRQFGSDLLHARVTGGLNQDQLSPWYASIADALLD